MPIIFVKTKGEKEKELQDLEKILKKLKKSQGIEGVLTGAVKSNYQKERIDALCKKLNLKSIAPLWHQDEEELMRELISSNFKVIFVAIAAAGLDESWLGREFDEKALQDLISLNKKYGVSLVGEGGETESFVLDCPLFKKQIKIEKSEKKWSGSRGEFLIKQVELLNKSR